MSSLDLAGWLRQVVPAPRRRRIQNQRLELRRILARFRSQPDFLIIGAQRCGTSSLYKYLGQHPQVIASIRKEVEYFSTRYLEGLDWYRAHFPLEARLRISTMLRGVRPLLFEATPDYMLDPRAPVRAADSIPEARLIVLIRNPIERAFSHYLHNRRLNQESLSFEEALNAEPTRLAGELSRLNEDPSYPARKLRRYSYFTRGMYAEQIERWRRQFPAGRILVVQGESVFGSPSQTFRKIVDFLGLRSWEPRQFHNFSYRAGSGPWTEQIRDGTRRELIRKFSAHNSSLYDTLGADLGWENSEMSDGRTAEVFHL